MRRPMLAFFKAPAKGRPVGTRTRDGGPRWARQILRLISLFAASFLATALLNVASCSMGGPGSPSLGPGTGAGDGGSGGEGGLLPDGGIGPLPFAPDPPSVYVAR
jgi:hypothetical protein